MILIRRIGKVGSLWRFVGIVALGVVVFIVFLSVVGGIVDLVASGG